MAAKFELFKGRDGQYYFRLKAVNGETIAVSEGYTTKASAKNGIASVKKNAPIAETVELD
ncbi:MAG: YegP family protein [Bacteroidota bacterium]